MTAPARRRSRLGRRSWLAILLLSLMLAGCADDESNRQFANDPHTPNPTPTHAIGTPTPVEPAAAARPPASPEALVDRRGAPDAAWWLDDGTLWAIGDGPPRAIVESGALAAAPSPDGSRVAVVTAGSGTYRIDVYTVEGERVETFRDVLDFAEVPASPAATPAGSAPSGTGVSLDWAPQGSRLLLAHASGALVDVPFDGKVSRISTRSPLRHVEQAAWSPRGDAIAVLTRDEEGLGSLALIDPSIQPSPVSVVAPVGMRGDSAKSVESFAWKPRGDGILFIEARRVNERAANGMVVAWDRATNSTQVLATGGQGGPTGTVAWVSVAPDGKALAYIVTAPGEDGGIFVGLFVRSMIDGQLYRVPVDADASPFQAWWLPDGLVWGATVGNADVGHWVRLVEIDGRGQRREIGELGAPVATPAASRAAKPGASPIASPVASPVATPAASPVASPVASPAATPAG